MLALMFIMIIMHEFFFCIYVFNFISLQLCVSVGVGGWGSVGVGGNCVWVYMCVWGGHVCGCTCGGHVGVRALIIASMSFEQHHLNT